MDETTTSGPGRVPPEEAQRIARAKAGDRAAFSELVAPHLVSMQAYARAIGADRSLAEDIVQESAMIALRSIDRLQDGVPFIAWFRAIVRFQTLGQGRRTRRLHPLAMDLVEGAAAEDDSHGDADRDRRALLACLEKLSPRAAALVRGHHVDDRPIADLAREEDLKEVTARSILHRARLALADCIQRRLKDEP